LLVLLKITMADHKHLTTELQFDAQFQNPSIGQSGGTVLMWKDELLKIEEVSTTSQGIHAMGWKACSKASRWVVHKWDRVNFLEDIWLPNMQPLNSIPRGPWQQADLNMKVNTLHRNGAWDLKSISYPIPDDITSI
ncbi:hypothetical protein A4A49_64570, partial [Nicotiana attenuata]